MEPSKPFHLARRVLRRLQTMVLLNNGDLWGTECHCQPVGFVAIPRAYRAAVDSASLIAIGPCPFERSRALRTLTRLCSSDAFSLIALGALFDLKFDHLAFVQCLVSVHLNGGEVNEHVFARLALDEPIAFRCVKPLHYTLFSAQRLDSSFMSGRYLPGVTPVGGRKTSAAYRERSR